MIRMTRRDLFGRLFAGVAAAVVAPKLIPGEILGIRRSAQMTFPINYMASGEFVPGAVTWIHSGYVGEKFDIAGEQEYVGSYDWEDEE